MITVFKIVHGLEGVPFDNLFTFHNTITRGNKGVTLQYILYSDLRPRSR